MRRGCRRASTPAPPAATAAQWLLGGGHPLPRRLQALVEAPLRAPPELLRRALRIEDAPLQLAQTWRRELRLGPRPGGRGHGVGQLEHRRLATRADV